MEAIDHEVNFWKGFIKTERFLHGWCGDFKTPELRQEVADFILSVPHSRIVDVGSGVVSLLTGLVKRSALTALDPLAKEYHEIFDYSANDDWLFRLSPPLPIGVEEVRPDSYFDIVHISNALDHSQDPKQGYKNLLGAVKKGGYLIIQGFENEGRFENYQGFHQWNLEIKESWLTPDGKETPVLQCCDKDDNIYFNAGFPHYFKKLTLDTGREWFIWISKRK